MADSIDQDYLTAAEAQKGLDTYRQYAEHLSGGRAKEGLPGIPTAEEEALQKPLEGTGAALAESQPVQDVSEAGKGLGHAVRGVVEKLGRAIGLDPKAAEIAGKTAHMASGLPGAEESAGESAAFTAAALVPGVGMALKGGKVAQKMLRLEHYSDKKFLTEISPEFAGSGQGGAELERKGAPLKSYAYLEGTKPEPRFTGKHKYQSLVPEEQIATGDVYTAYVKKYPNPDERERALIAAGFLGYRDDKAGGMSNVVALFKPVSTVTAPRKVVPLMLADVKRITQASAESLYETGGSTHNLINGNLSGTKGYAVSVFPEYNQRVPGMASAKDLEDYIASVSKKIDLHDENLSVGTWFNKAKNRTEFDISITVPDYLDAQAIARAHGQEAIRDLERGEDVFIHYEKGSEPARLRAEAGKATPQAIYTLAGALAGGAYGYSAATDDEKFKDTLIDAGLGAAAVNAIPIARMLLRGRLMMAEKPGTLPAAPPSLIAQIVKDFRADMDKFAGHAQSHEMTRDLAARLKATHIKEDWIEATYPGTTANAPLMALAAEKLADESLKLKDYAVLFAWGDQSPQMEESFLRQLAVVAKIHPRFMGLESEAGRSLEYIKDVENDINLWVQSLKGTMGKVRTADSPRRMAEIIATMKTPEQMVEYARQRVAPGLTDMFLESWVNGLISGVRTTVVNISSNALNMIAIAPAERALAWGIGTAREAVFGRTPTSEGGKVAIGEVGALFHGYVDAWGDAWTLAGQAFMSDRPIFGNMKMDIRRHSITAENFNFALKRFGFDDAKLSGAWARGFDYLGAAARVPGRFLMAQDEWFKQLVYRGELYAQANRAAYATAASENLTGVDFSKRVSSRVAEYLHDPELLGNFAQEARDMANYLTFTQEVGQFGKAVQTLASHPLGRLILPFTTVPLNVPKFAGERTPFAFFARSVRDEFAAGGSRADLAMSKIAFGSGTMALFATLAYNGIITGLGPQDKESRALWRTGDRASYSVNVSALARLSRNEDPSAQEGDIWRSYNRLDPLGILFGLAADGTDIMLHIDDPKVHQEWAVRLALVGSQILSNKTYVQGIASWFLAATDPQHYAERLEKSLARSLIGAVPVVGPVVKNVQQAWDPLVRDTQDWLDAVRSTIPGLSDKLNPYFNYWGEPTLREGGPFERTINPFYRYTAPGRDKVPEGMLPEVKAKMELDAKGTYSLPQRLADLQVNLTPPKDTVGKVELTQEQYRFLRVQFGTMKIGGKTLYQALKADYERWYPRTLKANRTNPESILHIMLQNTEKVYKGMALEQLKHKYKDVGEALGDTLKEKVQARKLQPVINPD